MKKIKALALLLAVVMVIGLMLPVFLAAINCETTVFCGGFRTIGQLPGIMPTIAAYLILSFFFRKDAMGVLNVLFAKSVSDRFSGSTIPSGPFCGSSFV